MYNACVKYIFYLCLISQLSLTPLAQPQFYRFFTHYLRQLDISSYNSNIWMNIRTRVLYYLLHARIKNSNCFEYTHIISKIGFRTCIPSPTDKNNPSPNPSWKILQLDPRTYYLTFNSFLQHTQNFLQHTQNLVYSLDTAKGDGPDAY